MSITNDSIVSDVLIDDATLTIFKLANACSVEYTWVVQHVEDGLLPDPAHMLVQRQTRFESGWLAHVGAYVQQHGGLFRWASGRSVAHRC